MKKLCLFSQYDFGSNISITLVTHFRSGAFSEFDKRCGLKPEKIDLVQIE